MVYMDDPQASVYGGAYYAASALGRVIGAIFSDTWEALLQLYFSLIAEGVIAGVLVRDCRVRTRIINLFMFFSSYLLSSSLNIMFGTYFILDISLLFTAHVDERMKNWQTHEVNASFLGLCVHV